MLLLQFLLLGYFVAVSYSTPQFDQAAPSAGGWITVVLANLSNPDGVLSHSGQKCDVVSECDPRAVVWLGSAEYGKDLMYAESQEWKNRNNLPFVFFNRTLAINQSIPNPLHLLIDVDDISLEGSTSIGRFHYTVNLEHKSFHQVTLHSTAENQLVSLTVQVAVVCFKSYQGPACADYCPDGAKNCLVGVRERTAVNASQASKQGANIIYWIIPGFGGVMLLVVLFAITIRMWRARSNKIVVGVEGQQQFPVISAVSLAHRLSNLDSGRFRNPVYGSVRRQLSTGNSHSCSVTIPTSSVATVSTEAATVATVDDDYEDMDAIRQHSAEAAASEDAKSRSTRPLPPPGAF